MTKELNQQTLSILLREVAYSMNTTPETRSRFSKEIAEELIATHGAFAHLRALEGLEDKSGMLKTEQMWRDVLMWLDELGGNDGRGVDKDRTGCEEEH